ncbi:MAG TPA: FUSC family protein [Candidatus Sulfopaludibacter sp.]|nr:FUSC family protein [Candidatus Sulfopaludibacter sp.]
MDSLAERAEEWPRPLAWLRGLLKEELAPYPGRGTLVARMVIAATLVMLITMTFRLPFGVQAIYALVISRDTHWATVKAVRMAILTLAVGAGYVVIGTMFSLDDAMLRTLWVIVSLFIAFFAIRIIADYGTAVGFGIVVVLSIPILDRHISTELKVTETLWAAGQTMLAAIIAALVALFFAGLKPRDFLVGFIAARLAGVEDLLGCYSAGRPVEQKTAKQITRMAMLGTSAMRRNIQRSGYSPSYAEQMGVVVALVGSLVDVAASLVSLDVHVSDEDRGRIQALAQNIAGLRADLQDGRIPRLSQLPVDGDTSQSIPLLPQMEKTVSLIAEVFEGSKSLSAHAPALPNEGEPPQSFFVRDELTNPEHIKFALKGCLAASLCYIIYTALNWNGISTAVMTCVLTALTTIGSSRQKQVLRFAGAVTGGAVSLAAQIFVLPALDSIAGFTLLFIVVSVVAAWIATSSPRLSYFGIQFALAFYIINLQDFAIQTSLVPGRDRVVGIMLGLLMMWLVFDQLWSAPTAVEMRKTFVSVFRLLAQYASQSLANNRSAAIERGYAFREAINNRFSQVRALADAVWFEFGSSRQRDLALRSRILGWQLQLRMMFISCVAMVKYRLQLPGFELPEPVRLAQQQFEECLARTLRGMADHLEGKACEGTESLEAAFAQLKTSVQISDSIEAQQVPTANMTTFLSLSERITGLAVSLRKEI